MFCFLNYVTCWKRIIRNIGFLCKNLKVYTLFATSGKRRQETRVSLFLLSFIHLSKSLYALKMPAIAVAIAPSVTWVRITIVIKRLIDTSLVFLSMLDIITKWSLRIRTQNPENVSKEWNGIFTRICVNEQKINK